MRWGWTEALAASLAGGIGFDYFFLPPHGFALESPEHLITLLAFLSTAVTIGGLAARASRHRRDAEERAAELGRLYEFGTTLRDADDLDTGLERITEHVVRTFGVEGAAFFDQQVGRVFRSGVSGGRIPDAGLRKVAVSGMPLLDRINKVAVVAVMERGNLAGSLGVAGSPLPQRMLCAVAERIGVAITKGLAERQSMEAELVRRSENLKSAVLDALAHEIKNPLGTLKVSVSTLLSQHPGDASQQRELLTIIDEEVDRIQRWIDEAVQVSSREAGEIHPDKTLNPVKRVIMRAMEGHGRALNGRQIEVVVDESLPPAVFDAEMIEKVIWQLLDNAIKYSPHGTPIRVSAESTGAEIIISVADSGCGISESDQQRIFEKHYRCGAIGSRIQGTGLGLPSAKSILEAHGGEIWVQSALGAGSVFRISLPMIKEASPEHCEDSKR
jgi:two-component system sensor histidine kinase KdpD